MSFWKLAWGLQRTWLSNVPLYSVTEFILADPTLCEAWSPARLHAHVYGYRFPQLSCTAASRFLRALGFFCPRGVKKNHVTRRNLPAPAAEIPRPACRMPRLGCRRDGASLPF